ncbi:MAG: hypothetical protein QG599_801 [Pseudomonadota bacterium]|nr:hypothetical protein [Pseudomonadota bacterium]
MWTKLRWTLPGMLMILSVSFAPGYAGSPEAILKEGSCPAGYHTEGRYCVGNRGSDPPTAISKDGPCPAGYHTEGHYCVGNRNASPRKALPKDGPCPTGYHTEGRYCVSNHRE